MQLGIEAEALDVVLRVLRPIACKMRTDTRFFDFTSAVRRRIGPSNLPS
jgi:hypothetical protein